MIVVNEIFGPTFQGEGPTAGQRCGFIRLGGCNLKCVWCDTKYTWDWEHYNSKEELHPMNFPDIMNRIKEMGVTRIVVTGGEPMLQTKMLSLFIETCPPGWDWEIETAGTISPVELRVGLRRARVRFNVSPKLDHSGNPLKKRFKKEVLYAFTRETACFKFVVRSDDLENDLLEIEEMVSSVGIPNDMIWVMPECRDKWDLQRRLSLVAEAALQRGWNLSSRLQVDIWGDKRGV